MYEYYFSLKNIFIPRNDYTSIINSEKVCLFVCLFACLFVNEGPNVSGMKRTDSCSSTRLQGRMLVAH